MTGRMDDRAVREQVARVEAALEAIEGLPGEPRRTALDAVRQLVELYGEGWARALAEVEAMCPGGAARVAVDELVGHLLMIHGLHPQGVEARVRGALSEVEEAVNADGLAIELLSLDGDTARLRLGGNGHEPGAGIVELVKNAVLAAAPEVERVEVDAPGANGGGGPALVQLRRSGRQAAEEPTARKVQ